MAKIVQKADALTRISEDEHNEAKQKALDRTLVARLFEYTRPYARGRNLLLVAAVIRAIQGPALFWLIGFIINRAIKQEDINGLIIGMVVFTVLALWTAVNFHFRYRLACELGENVVHDIRRDIFDHLQRLTMSYHDRTKRGWLISRMNSDVEYVRMGVQDVLFVSLVQGGQMIIAACIMAYYNWKLFLVMIMMAPFLAAIVHVYRRLLSQAWRLVQDSYSRITATLAESIQGVRVTQGFVRQEKNAELFLDLAEDHAAHYYSAARLTGQFFPLLELNSAIFTGALLVIGGFMALTPDSMFHDPNGLEDIIQFLFMAGLFFAPINVIGRQYNIALTAMASADRLFAVLDTKPAFEDPPDAIDIPPIEGRVEFRDVSFEYVRNTPVLQDVNFTAAPGQLVALVGHTGSGKSTMINLISRFYLPTQGELTIDGFDIRKIKGDSLHKQMGIVLQQNFLFTGTIAENIRMGKPGATDEEIVEAARKLDVLDIIGAMPSGMQTDVGEGGGNLSLGQRQIVCFCRAMLADPRIMILDEATSSVDSMTELRIQKALEILLEGRTSFVVAHRLSTIRHADVVLVLEHGRIIERGTHSDLLRQRGTYADMYRQFIRASEQ